MSMKYARLHMLYKTHHFMLLNNSARASSRAVGVVAECELDADIKSAQQNQTVHWRLLITLISSARYTVKTVQNAS